MSGFKSFACGVFHSDLLRLVTTTGDHLYSHLQQSPSHHTIQEAGALAAAVKFATTCYFIFISGYDYKRLDTSLYFTITNFHTEFR